MRKSRFFLILVCFLLALVAMATYLCDKAVRNAANGKLYDRTESIPFNKVGLLLGTGKYLGNGYLNPYYTHRVEAAVRLIKSAKIKYLIVSGDNGRNDYNEPEQMRRDLMAAVDSNLVYLDYAGFRTFDSIVRLKEVFKQNAVTIISQPFHNERAIYIAKWKGISALGFNAEDVGKRAGVSVQIREKFARVKLFLDFLFGTEPKFLGQPVNIP